MTVPRSPAAQVSAARCSFASASLRAVTNASFHSAAIGGDEVSAVAHTTSKDSRACHASTVSHLLVGFVDEGRFGERRHDWEPDDEFVGTDDAIEASRRWLANHPDGIVEVIDFSGSTGSVVALVTNSGVERIHAPPPKPKKPGRLDRWMDTRIGWTVTALAFVAAGALMILYPEAMARRGTAPGFIRFVGVMTVGFFGSVMLARVAAWLRSRISAK